MATLGVFWFKLNLQVSTFLSLGIGAIRYYVDKTLKE